MQRFDVATHSPEWKETLWEEFATAAQVFRAVIQRSQATKAALSLTIGINVKTAAKWRKRKAVEDLKTGHGRARVLGFDAASMVEV
jgi:hypothetical protein